MQPISLIQIRYLIDNNINDDIYHLILFTNEREAEAIKKLYPSNCYTPSKGDNHYIILRIAGKGRGNVNLVKDIRKLDTLENSIKTYYDNIGNYNIQFKLYEYQSHIITDL